LAVSASDVAELDELTELRLQRSDQIQALTDPELMRVDLDQMLVELLDRVRQILGADTAALLLLDEGAGQLVARAARGIEEELYQDVRIPLREGFAGRIAAERRPVLLDRVDRTTVANPILWEKGIRSLLGVPLLSDGAVLGVLHVGRLSERPFDAQDTELMEMVAERVTGAVQARLLAAERAAASVLERALVPGALRPVSGFEVATRYVTASHGRGAGGDWYDAFGLPSGEVWVTVGDVAGHGLPAAAVMARLRTTIRAYAFDGAPPHEVVRLTDRTIQYFDPDVMATAACLSISPAADELWICSAGHPPPIAVIAAGEAPRPLTIDSGPPLGAVPNVPRSTTVVPFPAEATLVLYTDGLIERRGEAIDVGLERLCQAITADNPEVICRNVMFRLIGDKLPDDDVALIVLRRRT
jgi:phosphoserine phosphatase RsbU/P